MRNLVEVGFAFFLTISCVLGGALYASLKTEDRLQARLKECESKCKACERQLTQVSVDDVFNAVLPKAKPYVPTRFVREMVEAAMETKYGLLMVALILVESHFDPFAVSKAGAVGCAQIRPSDWSSFLTKKGLLTSQRDFRDPTKCVQLAEAVLDYFLEKTDNDIYKALVFYQCGEKNKKCVLNYGKSYAEAIIREYGYLVWKVKASW